MKLDVINPMDTCGTTGKALVYATNKISMALAFCGDKWDDMIISQGNENGQPYLYELHPGILQKVFQNRVGWIHVLNGKGFSPIPNKPEWTSTKKVQPISTLPVVDVLQTLKASGVYVCSYIELPATKFNEVAQRYAQRYKTNERYREYIESSQTRNPRLYSKIKEFV